MLHLANLQPSIPAMKMKKNNSLQIGLYVSVYQNIKVNSKLKNSFFSTNGLLSHVETGYLLFFG